MDAFCKLADEDKSKYEKAAPSHHRSIFMLLRFIKNETFFSAFFKIRGLQPLNIIFCMKLGFCDQKNLLRVVKVKENAWSCRLRAPQAFLMKTDIIFVISDPKNLLGVVKITKKDLFKNTQKLTWSCLLWATESFSVKPDIIFVFSDPKNLLEVVKITKKRSI